MKTVPEVIAEQQQLIEEGRRLLTTGEGRRIREASGLTQQEVADYMGVTNQCVYRLETRSQRPGGATLARWAQALRALSETIRQQLDDVAATVSG